MGKVISILHYSALPVIGGVELTVDIHAKLLKEKGFEVNIIAGDGKPDKFIQELKSCYYEGMLQEILKGKTPDNFLIEVQKVKKKILKALKGTHILIVHNLFTMHFNLVATAALVEVSRKIKTIGWVHDLSYVDPTYYLPAPGDSPLKFIANSTPGIKWVTITNYRKDLLSNFFQIKKNDIEVIHNGIDPYVILPPDMKKAAEKLKILSYYPVALFPSRLTRRKNFEFAIDIISKLKGNPLLLLSAPPDPHNPTFVLYKNELKKRATEKGIKLIMFAEHCTIKDIETFYFLGDFLLITSKMEGFGLPAIEASLFRMPAALSNIPPLREIEKHFQSHLFFDITDKPGKIAKRIDLFLEENKIVQDRRTIIDNFSWDNILKNKLIPLIKSI
jgi:glycosyltransferase involved in cell wall biosynthesis